MVRTLIVICMLLLATACSKDGSKTPAAGDTDTGTGTGTGTTDADTDGDADTDADSDSDSDSDTDTATETETETDTENDPCDPDPQDYDDAAQTAFAPDDVAEDLDAFPIPVQAGAMRDDGAILTGYTAVDGDMTLRVWRDTDVDGEVALALDELVSPVDGFMKVELTGLAPGTWYRYGFFRGAGGDFDRRSVIGEFRTALHPSCAEAVVIAGTHGTNLSHQPFLALDLTADFAVDIFMQLGDYSYNDGANDIGQFRAKWDDVMDDIGYWSLLPVAGQYIVWDDHEFVDNSSYYSKQADGDPAFDAAKDAFYERHPVPRHDDDSYYESYRWGLTVEFFALDCRSQRLYNTPATQGGGTQYISPEQMAWLQQALLDSPCHFKVLLNSVPITNFPTIWDIAANDRWEGFDQREELLDFIVDNGIENVWSLSGDFHVGSVSTLEQDGPYSAIREVLMGPGGNQGNPAWWAWEIGLTEMVAPAAQFDFFYGFEAATIMTFDPVDNTVTVEFYDGASEEDLFYQVYDGV
jgi:alkaline phosphatase D